MFSSWKVGRPFGIDLKLHSTFWLLPAFVFLTGWFDGGPRNALLDTAVILTVFGCVALHELGHALAARMYGIRTQDITLYPIGGVARLDRIPERPLPEIVIALAGPAVNVVIALLLLPLVLANGMLPSLWPSSLNPVPEFLVKVFASNVMLVVFNLIPAFPMDGGRVLRAFLSWFTDRVSATNAAATLGSVIAVCMGIYGLFYGMPMLVVLAVSLFIMGRQEAEMVRYTEAYRRRQRMWYDDVWTEQQPTTRQRDRNSGWVYDARTGDWIEYRDDDPFRRFRRV
jgi:Zn-dependent protease